MGTPYVRIQHDDFDLSEEVLVLRAESGSVGAVVSFLGIVRDHQEEQGIDALELEHYPGMTERAILSMIEAAKLRFSITNARVLHRIGRLKSADQIVLVAVAASHRADAFQACEFLMDYLKTQAPFWKKAISATGDSIWVDAKETDDQACRRWGLSASNAQKP